MSAVQGSSLTLKDLSSYRSVHREHLEGNFAGFRIIVPGAPSGGPLLLAALDSIAALNLSHIDTEESSPVLLHKLAQSIQQNYAGFFDESGKLNSCCYKFHTVIWYRKLKFVSPLSIYQL